MEVINKVIQEMEELTSDVGLKISVDKTNYMNTQNTNTNIYNLKPRTLIRKNIKRYQNLNIWCHWLLMVRIVEKISSKNNSRESILSGSLKNYKSKIYISQDTKLKICTTTVIPIVLYDCKTWAMT